MGAAVSSYRYQPRRSDEPLRTRLVELAREKPRFGYRRLHVLLQRNGETVNHKKLYRVYRAAGLSLRRKKRKHCVRTGQPLWKRASVYYNSEPDDFQNGRPIGVKRGRRGHYSRWIHNPIDFPWLSFRDELLIAF